jgi:dephospho-CoA kinase
MIEIVFLVEDDPDGGYTARALGKSIFTQADDLESLKEMIRDAVDCHFTIVPISGHSAIYVLSSL